MESLFWWTLIVMVFTLGVLVGALWTGVLCERAHERRQRELWCLKDRL